MRLTGGGGGGVYRMGVCIIIGLEVHVWVCILFVQNKKDVDREHASPWYGNTIISALCRHIHIPSMSSVCVFCTWMLCRLLVTHQHIG